MTTTLRELSVRLKLLPVRLANDK